MAYRVERDSIGEVKLDDSSYWGANTARAMENFRVSGLEVPEEIIRALALIKLSCAEANFKSGLLRKRKADAIIRACREVAEGRFRGQFPVDVFQTGSGTSTNMNLNEVIANRAAELMGGKKGDRRLAHPNDDVNMGQSSNDVFPSALHVAVSLLLKEKLIPSVASLSASMKRASKRFNAVLKAGRTHMMDAMPVTLGQEFSAYAAQLDNCRRDLIDARDELYRLPLGGTAVGTGVGTTARVTSEALRSLSRETGTRFLKCANPFEGLSSRESLLKASSAMKRTAVAFTKVSEDLRLMASGPRCGFAEISLPSLQAGSSIMAGKVNPVIPEMALMVSAQVIGMDSANTLCAMGGRFQLNTMMPLMGYNLVFSSRILANAADLLRTKCVDGIRADRKRCLGYATASPSIVTFLQPALGYDRAAELYKESVARGIGIVELVREKKVLGEKELTELLDPRRMTGE